MLSPSGLLPRSEGLECHQERQDAGARRRNKGQQQEHRHGKEDERDLGGLRQLLQRFKRLFQVHGFPFLAISGILRQISWRRPLTRRTYVTIS
jgi:hypothetical protein